MTRETLRQQLYRLDEAYRNQVEYCAALKKDWRATMEEVAKDLATYHDLLGQVHVAELREPLRVTIAKIDAALKRSH